MQHPFLIQTNSVEFALDPRHGSQWESLRFKIPNENQTEKRSSEWVDVVYGYKNSESFFSSGSFLMFPWTNRMLPNSFYPNDISKKDFPSTSFQMDSNGLPIHGTIYQNSWEIIEGKNRLDLLYEDFSGKRSCRLSQDFELGENEIKIHLEIDNLFPESWQFSVGYHPYFRLPIGSVDDWILQFYGRGVKINLDNQSLPILKESDFQNINKSSITDFPIHPQSLKSVQLDDLYFFEEGVQISLTHPECNYKIWIESIGDSASIFKYCQIYTPASRDRIAIEPMLTPGNFENLPVNFLNFLEPNEKKNFIFHIKIKSK